MEENKEKHKKISNKQKFKGGVILHYTPGLAEQVKKMGFKTLVKIGGEK